MSGPKIKVLYELEGCIDCTMLSVNGEANVDSDFNIERYEETFEEAAKDGEQIVATGEDLGFSVGPCDICGSKLGGDRFLFNVLGTE